METRDILIVIAIALSAFAVGMNFTSTMMSSRMPSIPSQPPHVEELTTPYRSNGEMIFMTGVNERGERIPFTGGPQWLFMHGGGCASCHGIDGRGGIYPMMCGIKTPDIRYSTLTQKHGMSEEDIKIAITRGIGDEGEELDYCMPRWQMTEKDLNDVIDYLKQLG